MVSKLRIGIYHNLHSGGAKRVVEEQVRRLAPRYDIALYSTTMADQAFANEQSATAVPKSVSSFSALPRAPSPFGRVNPFLRMLNLTRFAELSRRLAEKIDRDGFDVVLVHPCQVTQAPMLLRWLKTPTLYYCHELPRKLYERPIHRPQTRRNQMRHWLDQVDPLLNGWRFLLRHLDRQSARRSTRIVTNSRFTKQNVSVAYGLTAEVCYPGVDTSVFQSPSVEREPFVLSVGALTPNKGFDWIIRGLGTLPSAERPALILVSNYQETEECHYLSMLAEQEKVAVQFHISVSESELRDWYQRAGCVAYFPVQEPFGLVALEAMAAGAPLVAVAEGGVVETVVDGVTGVLVPRDPNKIGREIRRLITEKEHTRRLGANARQYVLEKWTWEQHILHLESILMETAQANVNVDFPES